MCSEGMTVHLVFNTGRQPEFSHKLSTGILLMGIREQDIAASHMACLLTERMNYPESITGTKQPSDDLRYYLPPSFSPHLLPHPIWPPPPDAQSWYFGFILLLLDVAEMPMHS